VTGNVQRVDADILAAQSQRLGGSIHG
jgi:hypothetical protein